jgi:hypothetical protein
LVLAFLNSFNALPKIIEGLGDIGPTVT